MPVARPAAWASAYKGASAPCCRAAVLAPSAAKRRRPPRAQDGWGSLDEAEQLYKTALALRPGDADILYNTARLKQARRHPRPRARRGAGRVALTGLARGRSCGATWPAPPPPPPHPPLVLSGHAASLTPY